VQMHAVFSGVLCSLSCSENYLTSLGECYTEQHHTGYYLLVELSIENTMKTVCIIYKCILYTTNYGIFNTM